MIIETNSREETQNLGRKLSKVLSPGMVVALEGDLGVGKTELVRGVMLELNPTAIVRSPSFSLVNSYPTPNFAVNHFDFYRLNMAEELFEIGYDEYISPDSVTFIEWAQMFETALPFDVKIIKFLEADGDYRKIDCEIEL